MTERDPVAVAVELLTSFAHRTGLVGDTPPRRYLWTDAFAVCTFLALHRRTGESRWLDTALALVDQVHATLGRHRPDDVRSGWISGLGEDEGREHPTRGGLRIGKRLRERRPGEPFDERLEWERDGQYFHYLTRWMHALEAVWRAAGDERPLRWAIELAHAAHAGFTITPGRGEAPRMVWKASIDLSRPLVGAMGAHDPLDGLVTFRSLRHAATTAGWSTADVGLDEAIADLRAMGAHARWGTDDPLGIGGLLLAAHQLAHLVRPDDPDAPLLPHLLDGAAAGLAAVLHRGALEQPARMRLAFRELGLSIGLHAIPHLLRRAEASEGGLPALHEPLELLREFAPLARAIETFWLAPAHQRGDTWLDHLDINTVMLAASLVPEGVLEG